MAFTWRSHCVVILTVGGLVGGVWACGARVLELPDGGYPEASEDGAGLPETRDVGPESSGDGYDAYPSEAGGYVREAGPADAGYEATYDAGYHAEDYDASPDVLYPTDAVYTYDGYDYQDAPPADTGPIWDGGQPMLIASGVEVGALAVDDTRVYWQNGNDSVIDCPVSGCPGNMLSVLALNGSGTGYGLYTAPQQLIAVDSSIVFYLTTFNNSNSIGSCAGGGCALSPATYWVGQGGVDAGGALNLQAVVTDSSNVYFTDGSTLYACPIGSTCRSAKVLLSVHSGILSNLAVAGSELYYVDDGPYTQSIRAVLTGGGMPRVVCESPLFMSVNTLVVSGGYAYFTTGEDESISIFQCPAAGGGAPTIFAIDSNPLDLVSDGTSLYWTNDTSTGTIGTCPLGASCAGSRTVAADQDYPQLIAVNSTAVFWATQTAIYSAAK
jgi:hypothetical protein